MILATKYKILLVFFQYDPNARATPLLLNDVDEDAVQSKLPKTGTSFLDTLLAMHLRDPKLTLEHIREEVDTVLFAVRTRLKCFDLAT